MFSCIFTHLIQTFVFTSGYMVLKFTRWLINSNFRLHRVSRALWSQSAKTGSYFCDYLFKAIHASCSSVNNYKSAVLHVFRAILIGVHWLIRRCSIKFWLLYKYLRQTFSPPYRFFLPTIYNIIFNLLQNGSLKLFLTLFEISCV